MTCEDSTCVFKHPTVCKYFHRNSKSKFDGDCAYQHIRVQDKFEEMKARFNKNYEINQLK